MQKFEPLDLLRDMVERSRRPLQGLFTLAAHATFITREKGHYAHFYARPSKRLSQALSIDREVLILFTSFPEQQQRTVKLAKELIEGRGGRLESTVTIIIHSDKDGNGKLPKWGRDIGLAVLPIFIDELPESSDQVERYLCHELFSHDPFDVTGPVSDDGNFYGRRNEAQELARKLQIGQVRSCLGIRKIGKTSIMNRVIQEVRNHHDCYCVVLDCSRDEIFLQNASELMSSLRGAITEAMRNDDQYAVVGRATDLSDLQLATSELLSAVRRSSKPILIFIDEFDYITPGSPTTEAWKQDFNRFWRNFRSIYQEAGRDCKCLSVMVSGVSAKWFAVESIEGVENAALAFIPEEYLSPLARDASIAMIKKIARTAGLAFSDAAADSVASACSDMPFWIRKGCSYVHRHVAVEGRPIDISKELADSLTSDFITREGSTVAQVAVGHLFRVYPELKKTALDLLEEGAIRNSRHHSVLAKYGVISQSSKPTLSGAMMHAAVVGIRDHDQTESEIAYSTTQATLPSSALLDWAEELAVLNKNRNLMEKRMRQLVVNFLRADSLQHRDRGSARERIFGVVPEYRRKQLAAIQSADDLIEKLLWLELKILVLKEWGVLQAVFTDKRLFEQHADITNERPDAHAKDADSADLALQRRSVAWLSDKLASV